MRLWHCDLINVLPRQQLVAQWRELSAIVDSIQKNGSPNHILVNKVMDYSFDELITYARLVYKEMLARGYKPTVKVWEKIQSLKLDWKVVPIVELFFGWHNSRYFTQCFYNLEEKYDCGGLTQEEWEKICEIGVNYGVNC